MMRLRQVALFIISFKYFVMEKGFDETGSLQHWLKQEEEDMSRANVNTKHAADKFPTTACPLIIF